MAKNKDSASYGIIGLGRFGTALAKSLAAAGKDVMIIDKMCIRDSVTSASFTFPLAKYVDRKIRKKPILCKKQITTLDVYKRQCVFRVCGSGAHACEARFHDVFRLGIDLVPVSYTHLWSHLTPL